MKRATVISIVRKYRGTIYTAAVGFNSVIYLKVSKRDLLEQLKQIGDNDFQAMMHGADLYIERYTE